MSEPELLEAAEAGDIAAVEALLAAGAQVNDASPSGETALMRATSKGRLNVVRLMLKAGADLNVRRADGMSPLIYAAFFGHTDVVQLLIDNGADLDASDRLGMTALDWAKAKGATVTADILRRAAASRSLPSASHPGAGHDEIGSEDILSLPEAGSVTTPDELADGVLDLSAGQGLQEHDRSASSLHPDVGPLTAEPAESSQTGPSDPGGLQPLEAPAPAPAATANEAGSRSLPYRFGIPEESGPRLNVSTPAPAARPVSSDETARPGPPITSKSGTEMEDGAADDTSRDTYPPTQTVSWFYYACLFLSLVIISATVTWVVLREDKSRPLNSETAAQSPPVAVEVPQAPPQSEDDAALTAALNGWLEATRARDVEKQMSFYARSLRAYYRKRYVPSSVVRADKAELYGRARQVDITAGEPRIRYGKNSVTASMRFSKDYSIESDAGSRSGEVVQELIWRKTKDGWKIISERDLTVVK